MKKQAVLAVLFFILFLGFITAIMPTLGAIFYIVIVTLVYVYIKPVYGFYIAFVMALLMNFNLVYDSPIRIVFERYALIILPLFLTLFIYLIRSISEKNQTKYPRYGFINGVLFLIYMWTVISVLWTIDIYHGINKIYMLAIGIVLFYLIPVFIKDKEDLEKVFKILVLWGAILAVSCFMSNKVDVDPLSIELTKDISIKLNLVTSMGRPGGFAPPQEASNILGFIFFVGIALYPKVKKSTKILLFCLGLFLIVNILATVSKGGIGAFMLGVLFFIFMYPSMRNKIISGTFIFIFFLIFLFVFNIIVLSSDRLVGPSEQQIISISTRLDFWSAGFDMLYNRWIGAGVGGFASIIDPWPGAHSFYFEILFDLGIIGLVLFFFLIIFIIFKLRKAIVVVIDQDMKRYLYCMTSALIMFFIHGLVEMTYETTYFWMLTGLLIAIISISDRTPEVINETI